MDVENLSKHYPVSEGLLSKILGSDNVIKAVDGVSLQIREGEIFGLIGESGSGKSTLGETIVGLERPTDGKIRFEGEEIQGKSNKAMVDFREHIQIIFQDPYESINPRRTVYQTIAEPLNNFRDITESEKRAQINEMLHAVGLRPPDRFLDLYPGHLSGGQRQRVNIARALILEPIFVVADEPVSMLDVSIRAGILTLLKELQSDMGFSMLYISHDISVVELIADRVGVMYLGSLVERGEVDQLIEEPMHPYSRALINSVPDFSGERERVRLPEGGSDETEMPSGCRFHPRCPEAFAPCPTDRPALATVDKREVACFLHHEERETD